MSNVTPNADFHLAGWRVRSEFEFPDLLPWTGDERPADIAIVSGTFPDCPAGLRFERPLLRIASDGACWFRVPGIAEYFVNYDATQIVVTAHHDAPEGLVRTFLLSTPFVLLCHKHRLTPIHASCVAIGGRAVLFAGPSCAGKSLLAAAFQKAGCSVLSDDVVAVDTASPGGPIVFPSFPRLRLWRDAVDRFRFDGGSMQQTRPEIEKYDVSLEHDFSAEPRRLAAIYHLQQQRKGIAESITPLYGAGAVRYAAQAVACGEAGRVLSENAASLQRLTALCAGTFSYSLAFQHGFDALEARVAALIAKHQQRL